MNLSRGRYDRHRVAIVLAVLTVLLWWPRAKELAEFAYHSSVSSYVLAIPGAALLLLWCSREEIFGLAPVRLGPARVLTALVTVIAYGTAWRFVPGPVSASLTANTLGLVCLWIVLFLAVYGPGAALKSKLPLVLLLFTVPLPEKLLATITSLLQHQSTSMAEIMLRVIDVPVYRDHFVLTLSRLSVVVGPQCSGIRSLVVSLLFSVIAGYLYLRSVRTRGLFLAIALALSLLKNAVRIVLLAILGNYVDPAYLAGSLHREGGLLLFLATIVILVPVLMMLSRIEMSLPKRPNALASAPCRESDAELSPFSRGAGLQVSAQVCKHSHP